MSDFVPFTSRDDVRSWLSEVISRCQPDRVHLCQGTQEEIQSLTEDLVKKGLLIALNDKKRPESYLARSSPDDVARVESRTFICTPTQEEAGPTNNWKEPQQMREHLESLFSGCMRGRTCYIIPFCMGPIESPLAKIGFEITEIGRAHV